MPALAKAVAFELLALVQARVGVEVGKSLEQFRREHLRPADQVLGARIGASTDRGVVALVAELARELGGLIGGRVMVLALDAGERLRDEDLRVLADLQAMLPERVRVRVAFQTSTAQQRAAVASLVLAGVEEIRVGSLGRDAVADWLAEESLDRQLAADVHRATGGYPLLIGDVTSHLLRAGSLFDVPLNQQFARLTEESWHTLDPEIARHARRLCVFPDPPPRERLLAYLDVDDAVYGDVEDRLGRAGIYSVEVNGQKWFHEQRRQYVFEKVIGEAERSTACRSGAELLLEQFLRDDDPAILGVLAVLVSHSPALQATDPLLAATTHLPPDELALAAASIELQEANAGPVIDADGLLSHARDAFGATGDLVAALEAFAQKNFAVVRTNQHASGVTPAQTSDFVRTTLIGRAAREFGRLPVPSAASAIFENVLAIAEPFENAVYGLGWPSIATLANEIVLLRQAGDAASSTTTVDLGSNLLIRGSYGPRPLYGAVTYSDEASRDAAFGRLIGYSDEAFGEQYALADVVRHPIAVVPSRRMLAAAQRLVRTALGSPADDRKPTLSMPRPLAYSDAVGLKVAAIAVARAQLSQTELLACELEQPVGYVYFEDDDVRLEVEIFGGREGVDRLQRPPGLELDGPYTRYQLRENVNLQPHERLGGVELIVGDQHAQDPVVAVLGALASRSAQFNARQLKRVVLLDEEALRQELQRAAECVLSDAAALGAAVPLGGERRGAEALTTYVLGYLGAPVPGLVPAGDSRGRILTFPSPDGVEHVQLALVPRPPGDRSQAIPPGMFEDRFGVAGDHAGRRTSGDLRSLLADLLQHRESELAFAHPDEPNVAA